MKYGLENKGYRESKWFFLKKKKKLKIDHQFIVLILNSFKRNYKSNDSNRLLSLRINKVSINTIVVTELI